MISATCANILAILASASGGETIQLTGACPAITITRAYTQRVVIDASKASVAGLRISGRNVTWRGGAIKASGGGDGFALAGYGIKIVGSDVTIENVKVGESRKGLVLDKAARVVIANNIFDGVTEDGIIANASSQISVLSNIFRNTTPHLTQCTFLNGSAQGLSARDCTARGGQWTDGSHPDAVQLRNGMTRVLISGNTVTGATQGITQMDTIGDAPLSDISIQGNSVAVTYSHAITLGDNCNACSIRGNSVTRGQGSVRRAVLRPGLAIACNNRVQDSKIGTEACAA